MILVNGGFPGVRIGSTEVKCSVDTLIAAN
jgi:hypothetical protein